MEKHLKGIVFFDIRIPNTRIMWKKSMRTSGSIYTHYTILYIAVSMDDCSSGVVCCPAFKFPLILSVQMYKLLKLAYDLWLNIISCVFYAFHRLNSLVILNVIDVFVLPQRRENSASLAPNGYSMRARLCGQPRYCTLNPRRSGGFNWQSAADAGSTRVWRGKRLNQDPGLDRKHGTNCKKHNCQREFDWQRSLI